MINSRCQDMVIPCLVKGSDHKIAEISESEASVDKFQG